jgi:hypothetical protein
MRATLCALLLLLATPLAAQELDVWDISDFVDPRVLASETEDGRLACPCDGFLIVRVMGGAASNYIDVVRPTNRDIYYAHLAASYYRGRWQANWKRTQVEPASSGGDELGPGTFVIPISKNTLQIGYYHGDGRHWLNRTELTWSAVEHEMARVPPPGGRAAHRYEHELGLEHDFSFRVGRLPIRGSLTYVGRFGPKIETAANNQRASYIHRFPRIPFGRFSLDLTAAGGILHTSGRWQRMTFYPSAHLISPSLPRVNARVHLKYAPAVQQILTREANTTRSEWRDAQQIALFIDVMPFKKRFRARTK